MPKSVQITGFIKHEDAIGMYRAPYEAWVLDADAYTSLHRIEDSVLTKAAPKRFDGRLRRPIRRDDVRALVKWFDDNASFRPDKADQQLDKMDYLKLDNEYEMLLPVVLYDFDERKAFENPDLNPRYSYDDYLPEGWDNVVVEGFDALVPDEFVFWARFASRLADRDEEKL